MKQRLKQVLHPGELGRSEHQILAYRLGPSYPPAQRARLRRWKLRVSKRTLLEDVEGQPAMLYVPCELWCPLFLMLPAPNPLPHIIPRILQTCLIQKVSAALPVLQLAQNFS